MASMTTNIFRFSIYMPLARAARYRRPFARLISTRATQHVLNTGAKIPALGFGTF